MNIAVIIPAYNSEKYIRQAILSALNQKEVTEVIVIDDGSQDNSSGICIELMKHDPKLKLIHHPNHENKGAGDSRNLGIQHASSEYIAFLDADDYYLNNRFETAKNIFEKYPQCDGVYECLGIYFETEAAELNWFKRFNYKYTTLAKILNPEELVYEMAPLGKQGWFSGDALVVKKSIFEKCGYFSNLRLSQDTELFMKMAITSKLYAGNITSPVAVRRVHDSNRITASKEVFYVNRILFWKSMIHWALEKNIANKFVWKCYVRFIKTIAVCMKLNLSLSEKMRIFFNNIFSGLLFKILFHFISSSNFSRKLPD